MRTWFKIIGWIVGVVGSALLVLRFFFFDVWTVPVDDPLLAAAIEPTLTAGDVVVVARYTDVSRGNLLRCDDPQAPGRFVIARAIGHFGDNLDIANEVVAIDGHRTPSPRACDPPFLLIHDPQSDSDENLSCSVEEYGDTTYEVLRSTEHPHPPFKTHVEVGKWYVLSDDRHVHLDSRDFGALDALTCKHIVYRLVSAKGFGDSKKRLSIIW